MVVVARSFIFNYLQSLFVSFVVLVLFLLLPQSFVLVVPVLLFVVFLQSFLDIVFTSMKLTIHQYHGIFCLQYYFVSPVILLQDTVMIYI